MDSFRDVPDTKDEIVTHLQRVFSFVDRHVECCRSEREEDGISDEFVNMRAKLLQATPDPDLCSLLFTAMKKRQHAVTQLGVELMDKKKVGGGCLNEASIDIHSLEGSKGDRVHWFGQIWTAGVSDSSRDSRSTEEEKRKKSSVFNKGHQLSSNPKTLRDRVSEMDEEMKKKDAIIADLEKELGRLTLQSSRMQSGWAGDFDVQSPGYNVDSVVAVDSENAKRKLRRQWKLCRELFG